ncbi:MAG: ATP-binding protein, partial [Bacteroidota bacterium]
LNLPTLAIIPGIYILVSIVNLVLLHPLKPIAARLVQIGTSLVLPFFLQWWMGGYHASGLVMLWSSVSFLAVLAQEQKRYTYAWVMSFLFLFTLSFLLDDRFRSMVPPQITETISVNLLAINILFIGAIIFVVAWQRLELDRFFIQKLQESNRELDEVKSQLEEKVEERTRDLETTVLLLQESKNEIKRALQDAREATDSKSYFLTNISHEIRTPLNAILGYAQIISLRSKEVRLPDDLINYINGIHTSGNLLMDLVNDVLDLSRLDAGKLTLSMESVNVRQTIKKTYELAKTKAMQKEVHCSFSLDPRTPEMVETDASRLSQILMNLLSNAVKFTPQGKNVSLNVTMDADRLLLRVADEGPGITVEDQERIFLPYVQGNAEITRQFGGAGLGLSIVKRLVDLFGGTISVNSLPGEGSVFTVSLPVIPAISTNSQPVEQLPLSRVRFVSGQKILVVEDNPVNVQVMQGFLQELGLKVIVAGNGKEGIDMVIAHRPDVILMDIHMPVMNGIEALKVLVSMDMLRNIPIICLTADIFGEHRKNYLSLGFS